MSQYFTKTALGVSLLAATSLAGTAFAQHRPAYEPSLLPSGAQAGQCYVRVHIPAEYSTTTESVLVEEGYNTTQVEQAQLSSRQEQVEIKEASVRYEVRQPSFRTVSERIMTAPGYDKLSVSKPTFNMVQESMRVTAPRTVWKLGNPGALIAQGYNVLSTADAGRNGQGYSSTQSYGAARSSRAVGGTACGPTCEIWCLVEEPSETVTFNRKVMTSPGRVQRTPVPARYSTISKQIVSDLGGVREIPISAEYRSITVQGIVRPEGVHEAYIPPKYASIDKKHVVSESRYEWRRVVCRPGTGAQVRSQGRITQPYSSGSSYGSTSSYGATQNSSHSSGSTYSSRSQPITYGSTGSTSNAVPAYGSGPYTQNNTSSSSTTTGTYYYGTDKPVSEGTRRPHRIRIK